MAGKVGNRSGEGSLQDRLDGEVRKPHLGGAHDARLGRHVSG